VVKALLEVGRELVMIMHNGKTCLLISASKGHQEVLKALLEVGGREL
jgi:ankyrin repeat protein